MLPLRIEGATRRLAENQDKYHALSIKDVMFDTTPAMQSLWEFTPAETAALTSGYTFAARVEIMTQNGPMLAAIWQPEPGEMPGLRINGGRLRVSIPGTMHPAIRVWVKECNPVRLHPEGFRPMAVLTYVRAPEVAEA